MRGLKKLEACNYKNGKVSSKGNNPGFHKIHIKDASGTILAHDLIRIIPGKSKGPVFKKGRVVQKADIPELLKIGKEHLYVLDLSGGLLHEDDAALRTANAACGDDLSWTAPKEGKSSILSTCDGLLKIDVELLLQINRMGDIIVATFKNSYPCRKDQIDAL